MSTSSRRVAIRSALLVALSLTSVPALAAQEPDFERLVAELRADREADRDRAAAELERSGAAAVPALIAALDHRYPTIRLRAGEVLGRIGAPAVPALKALLEQPEAARHTRALFVLSRIGPAAAPALPQMLACLDRHETGSVEAVAAVGAAAIPELEQRLVGGPNAPYPSAARALTLIGPPAVPALERALQAGPEAQSSAWSALRDLGPRAAGALPTMLALLRDAAPDSATERDAIPAIGKVGAAALPGVRALLVSDRAELRVRGVRCLTAMGPAARPGLDSLRPLLHGADAEFLEHAYFAIGAIGGSGRELIPDLIQGCRHEEERVRNRAGEALLKIGSAAVPALLAELDSKQPEVRATAARVLGFLAADPAGVLPRLERMLDDADETVRAGADEGLTGFGARAVPIFAARLKAADASVRERAAVSLRRMGRNAATATDALAAALADKEVEVRVAAAGALATIGPPARGAADALLLCLADKEPPVRYAALRALAALEPTATAVPSLVALHADPDAGVRAELAHALGRVRPPGADVIVELRRLVDDAEPTVRAAAIKGLGDAGEPGRACLPAIIDRMGIAEPLVVRRAAILAIHQLMQSEESAVMALADGLTDADPAIGSDCRNALSPRRALLVGFAATGSEAVRQKAAAALAIFDTPRR